MIGRKCWQTRIAFGFVVLLGICFPTRTTAAETDPPAHLPRYDLHVALDLVGHRAHIREKITWTNSTKKPLEQLVFNFYPHYRVPAGDYLYLAKMLELLRMQPSQGIDRFGRHGVIGEAKLLGTGGKPLAEASLCSIFTRFSSGTFFGSSPEAGSQAEKRRSFLPSASSCMPK